MDNFRSVLIKRLFFIVGYNILAVAFAALSFTNRLFTADGSDNIKEFIQGSQVGIFMGLQIIFLIFIRKYNIALKSEDNLKKLYIQENDERIKLINDKIGGTGFNFIIGAMAVAVISSGFFNQLVFITLMAVLIFIILVKAYLKIYYRMKY